jgi:hypothetical protein
MPPVLSNCLIIMEPMQLIARNHSPFRMRSYLDALTFLKGDSCYVSYDNSPWLIFELFNSRSFRKGRHRFRINLTGTIIALQNIQLSFYICWIFAQPNMKQCQSSLLIFTYGGIANTGFGYGRISFSCCLILRRMLYSRGGTAS